ncbi:MAG TPA: NADH:ubiquinone reductase (Na(+)-transporting) subunit B [Bacteroidetes bacterium]|nr:NADH:ubiquinone reductase (Na(+)-transporting) subunit B [Bacteroidota bacterium]
MKFLKDTMDKLRPTFSKGGKFQFLHSTFEAFDTFLFVPGHTTHGKVHVRDGIDMKRTMIVVVIAMIPALLFGMWNVGYQHFLSMDQTASHLDYFLHGLIQVLPIIIVSYGVGLGIEFAFCQIKGHAVNEGFLVTGMLIPLCLPPTTPLWMVALGTAFAVIIGKEIFGGSGMNLLNPALTARVFLFFAYPAYMSGEFLSDGTAVWFSGNRADIVDGFSGATTLSVVAGGGEAEYSVMNMFLGLEKGSIGETSVLAILIGAVILVVSGVGSWKIMASTFAGGLLMGGIFNWISGTPFLDMPAYQHLLIGGFAFGAVFMATDPVSAAQTERGKIIYGLLIGILTVLIRVGNPAYPEGMMMAILLMNVFAPLIDYFVVESNKKRRLKRATV